MSFVQCNEAVLFSELLERAQKIKVVVMEKEKQKQAEFMLDWEYAVFVLE